jgi:hypothetical protein
MDVLIKNVDAEAWKKFKIEAIRNDKRLGEFFSEMIGKGSIGAKVSKKQTKEVRDAMKTLQKFLEK